MIKEYDSTYNRQVPKLQPTEAELEQIRKAFAQFQLDVADRPEMLAVTRQETVCAEVEI